MKRAGSQSLSSDVRCVTPTCIGSGSGVVLTVTAEGSIAERRKGRLERIRLSIRIASSINCSSVLPSSRQANSDWSSVVRPCGTTALVDRYSSLFVQREYER